MADTAITISDDRVSPLSVQEQAATGFSHKFRVLYSDIALGAGATDTVTMTLGATPAKFIVNAGLVNVSTAFAGTGAMTIIVGTALSTAALIASQSILTAGALVATSTTAISTNLKAVTAGTLVATFTNATSGSPSELTAGELAIYVNMQDLTELP